MLVDVLTMPPARGHGIDRRFTTSHERVFFNQNLHPYGLDQIPFETPNLILGSRIPVLPRNIHKAIYTTPDHPWVLEVVYAQEPLACRCLYVKTIGANVDVMIPAESVRAYSEQGPRAFTLGDTLSESFYHCSAPLVFSATVPPIFSDKSLYDEIHRLISLVEEHFPVDRLQQLYHHEPVVLEALLRGTFVRPPHLSLVNRMTHLPIARSKWFLLDQEEFNNRVSPGRSFYNHPDFDDLAMALLYLRPTELRYSILMSHAIDGLTTLGVTHQAQDIYQHALPDVPRYLPRIHQQLGTIVAECMATYCKVFGYDSTVFSSTGASRGMSSLTVEKNLYDEVTISFRDQLHRNYVRFYTSFPAIALATWGMARGL